MISDLFESLKINYAIIVEDDFRRLKEPEKVLGMSLMLPKLSKDLILDKIGGISPKFSKRLKNYYNEFSELTLDTSERENLLHDGHLYEYLKQTECSSDFVKETEKIVKGIRSNFASYNEIFFSFGVTEYTDQEAYKSIFQMLDKICIRVYNDIYNKMWDEFKKDLLSVKRMTKSGYFVAFVDKKLGTGDDKGIAIIENDLKGVSRSFKPISIIISSKAKEKPLKKYDDYFMIEVSKFHDDIDSEIVKGLVLCAYAIFFKRFKTSYNTGLNQAYNLALQNYGNICQILNHAHIEGSPPYEALSSWFILSSSYNTNKSLLPIYKDIFALSRFFNANHLKLRFNNIDFSDELLEIKTHEIFDYSINQKFLPVMPGDIFAKGEEYFILLGQSCDIALRNDNERKTNVAELIKIEILKNSKNKNKYECKVKNGNYSVSLQNFKLYDELKCLKIVFNKSETVDLKMLDSCMFNLDGEAKIPLSSELETNLKNSLPSNKDDYFKDLQSLASDLYPKTDSIVEALNYITEDHNSILQIEYTKEDDSASWGFKRICRVRDPFLNAILDSYVNHKGRVGLNTIDISHENMEELSVFIGFPGEKKRQVSISVLEKSGSYFVKKDSLLRILEGKFKSVLSKWKRTYIELKSNDYFVYGNKTNHEVTINYWDKGKKKFHDSNKYLLSRKSKVKYLNLKSSETFEKKEVSIVNELFHGIKLIDEKVIIKLENGIITRKRKP